MSSSLTVTCRRGAPVAEGASVPLVISLRFDRSLIRGRIGVLFYVENSNQNDTYSNRSNDVTYVAPRVKPGLNLSASFGAESVGRVHLGRGVLFNLGVTNVGSVPGTGSTTVTYTVTEGLQYLSSASGPDFSCAKSGDTLTCTRSGPLPLGTRVVAAVVRGHHRSGHCGDHPHAVRAAGQRRRYRRRYRRRNDRACDDYIVTPEPGEAAH